MPHHVAAAPPHVAAAPPHVAAQTVLKSAEASLVRVLNEWLLLVGKNDELAEGWLEEASTFARETSRLLPRLTPPAAAARAAQLGTRPAAEDHSVGRCVPTLPPPLCLS